MQNRENLNLEVWTFRAQKKIM